MVRFLISTTEEMWGDLKASAEQRGQTLSGLIRQILWDWAKQNGLDRQDSA